MEILKEGDIVARKSYGQDVLFRVVEINNESERQHVVLHGINYRIVADSPIDDLELQLEKRIQREDRETSAKVDFLNRRLGVIPENLKKNFRYSVRNVRRNESISWFNIKTKLLHIDGDKEYLKTCLEHYDKIGIDAIGKHVAEKDQPNIVYDLLSDIRPEILVLTGHDAYTKSDNGHNDISDYKNTSYYIQAVKNARNFEPSKDQLIIFAGACQSYFSKIIEAGANFASSPYRVLIHTLDPVYVCSAIAKNLFDKTISVNEVISNTITGYKGIGGIQTRGLKREGYPKEPF